jgi:GST-like protein
MADYTLYGMGSPNVIKVLLLLEELGADYDLKVLDVIGGQQHDPAFRAIGPNGKVPVLVDHRAGSDRAIFESGAILLDLAERYGRFLGGDADGKSVVVQWLMFQMSGAGPIFGQAIHFNFATKEDGYAKARFTAEMDRLLGVIATRLGEAAWLGGEAYSIADMALWPWIRTIRKFFPDRTQDPVTSDWFDRIAARPATGRTLEVIQPVNRDDSQRMRHATQAELNRYFGRAPA